MRQLTTSLASSIRGDELDLREGTFVAREQDGPHVGGCMGGPSRVFACRRYWRGYLSFSAGKCGIRVSRGCSRSRTRSDGWLSLADGFGSPVIFPQIVRGPDRLAGAIAGRRAGSLPHLPAVVGGSASTQKARSLTKSSDRSDRLLFLGQAGLGMSKKKVISPTGMPAQITDIHSLSIGLRLKANWPSKTSDGKTKTKDCPYDGIWTSECT